MAAHQRVLRTRRRYNLWVANEMLEDYALRFTATRARRWSAARVANTALGSISFLALEAIGGAITVSYGFNNAVAAIMVVAAVIFFAGLPISYYAAKYGVDIDLLTRGAGFGYIGSTVTSLIYASFTFIFFALEGVILAMALEMWLGLPLIYGYVLSSLAVIPIVTYGITVISRFQVWTQPLWIALHLAPFIFLAIAQPESFGNWTGMPGEEAGSEDGAFHILAFGAATTVIASLVAQIGEQVDFLRFLPRRRQGRHLAWWVSLIAAGPGWIVPGAVKLLAGSYLAYLCIAAGVPAAQATEPTRMYLQVFGEMFNSPAFAAGITGIFVILSQMKINVTNAYAGSIAWSNFFSRLTHSHPGRVVWLVFNVVIALMLMAFGVYTSLQQILGLYSLVALSWVGAIVADLVINKPLGLSPPHIEFKRAHLYDINPVGIGAMILAVTISVTAHLGVFGEFLQAFSAFTALTVALGTAPLIAKATRGRYYLARENSLPKSAGENVECVICEHSFERADMALCTAYGGPICSLCCSLDARCHDACKPPNARMPAQLSSILRDHAPAWLAESFATRLGRFVLTLGMSCLCIGAALALIYNQTAHDDPAITLAVGNVLWMTFLVMTLIAGVASLLFMLTQESRRVALEETERQSALLMHEINAHERTDAKLQKAKDAAEAANFAKSRYMFGISHEIRAPLNAIYGYAQILSKDPSIPAHRHNAVEVIGQSALHLTRLIEGLLDISRIEAGHLTLNNDEVHLPSLLEQFVDMFRIQAQAKGLTFIYDPPDKLPGVAHTDEKRLRQVLFNLLTNAVKFTGRGHIAFRIRMRSEVAEFIVEDTGIGIDAKDIARIFEPFERGSVTEAINTPGMGLGLTITKLLTETMGGEVDVTSTKGVGSTFKVKLFLPEVALPERLPRLPRPITGYRGNTCRIMVVDDDASHRELMRDILVPLGFDVTAAANGAACRRIVADTPPDLFLLDISMPDISGWDLAEDLRRSGFTGVPIVMVSANAQEYKPGGSLGDLHDEFLVKPVDVSQMIETIGDLLKLEWIYEDDSEMGDGSMSLPASVPTPALPVDTYLSLKDAVDLGYVRGITTALDTIAAEIPGAVPWTIRLRSLLKNFALKELSVIVSEAEASTYIPDAEKEGRHEEA